MLYHLHHGHQKEENLPTFLSAHRETLESFKIEFFSSVSMSLFMLPQTDIFLTFSHILFQCFCRNESFSFVV